MQKIKYVFFDLDGTIFNSQSGISRSVIYALEKFGIGNPGDVVLRAFIGPPLKYSFMTHFGFDEEKAEQAIGYYREYYGREGIFKGYPYEHIDDLLRILKSKGIISVLATSKPEEYAKRIISHLEFDDLFYHIAGADMAETRVEKADIIRYAADSLGINDMSEIVMVGDRKYDTIGAHEAGVRAVGVLYGFGTEAELRSVETDYIAANVGELLHVILNLSGLSEA